MKRLSAWLALIILLSGCEWLERNNYEESLSCVEDTNTASEMEETPSASPLEAMQSPDPRTIIERSYAIHHYPYGDIKRATTTYVKINSKDQAYTEQINKILYDAQITWVKDFVNEEFPYPPSVQCHNERYLSIVTDLHERQGNNHRFPEYAVTVDMQKGELLMLNDIIEVCEEFAEQIQECRGVVKADTSMAEHDYWGDTLVYPGMKNSIAEYTIEEIMEMLEECSKIALDYQDDAFGLLTKSTFFLEEGYLTIILKNNYDVGSGEWLTFDMAGIEEYLLVEKW